MIKSVEFINFRNLSGKYHLKTRINLLVGKNSSGKTNLLDGIRLAFSTITGDYFRISKTDFNNSDDSTPIIIKVELDDSAIPSLDCLDITGATRCGFEVIVKKGRSGRYSRELRLLRIAFPASGAKRIQSQRIVVIRENRKQGWNQKRILK